MSLGPKGYLNIQTTEHGPADTLRLGASPTQIITKRV